MRPEARRLPAQMDGQGGGGLPHAKRVRARRGEGGSQVSTKKNFPRKFGKLGLFLGTIVYSNLFLTFIVGTVCFGIACNLILICVFLIENKKNGFGNLFLW